MTETLPLRIFLASPSDVESEREVVRACVEEFNRRRGRDSSVAFEVIGWESVRGTAQRPQEAIDELIGESHFLVVLLRRSWGTESGSQWGYTSGTEEELFTGLLALGQAAAPMRDVWVAFLDCPDPDDRVVQLRRQISQRHTLMYEAIADISELKEKFAERLKAWEPLAGPKARRHIDLLPSSGKDVLGAQRLRLDGEKLLELGQTEAGRESLREASVRGGPVEALAYARFLARHGDLDGANAETQRAIDHFTSGVSDLYSPLAAEAFAAQAGILRRQGKDLDAIGRLEHALTLLESPDPYSKKVRCRILDELGLARRAVDNLAAAREAFGKALALRREAGHEVDIAQSLVNLARLEIQAGDLAQAGVNADEAIEGLRATPPTALHANVEVLAAQVRLRQGRPNDGVPHAERALSMNRQLGNRRGEAISLLVLAQCCRAAGQDLDARAYAAECIEVNRSMGNDQGVQRAQWIIDQLEG